MKELFERANSDLILSRRDLHIILDAMPIPLSWARIPGGLIQFCNLAFKKTFGYADQYFRTVDQLIDETYVRACDRDMVRACWRSLWEHGHTGISEIEAIELQMRCADGNVLTVKTRGILLHDLGLSIATFEDISHHKTTEETLKRIAFEDPLTGLPNRRALQMRWVQEMERPHTSDAPYAAVLLMDLDGFKTVNDRFGHDVGDATLAAAAERLRECIHPRDFLCRLGGDEFLVLVPHLKHPEQAEQTCQLIVDAFKRPLTPSDHSISLSISVGASLYPRYAADLSSMMKQADIALYCLKETRKGNWMWYQDTPPRGGGGGGSYILSSRGWKRKSAAPPDKNGGHGA